MLDVKSRYGCPYFVYFPNLHHYICLSRTWRIKHQMMTGATTIQNQGTNKVKYMHYLFLLDFNLFH